MGESFEMLHTFELKLKTNFSMIKALEEVFGNDLITKLSSNKYYCISNPIEIPEYEDLILVIQVKVFIILL